MFNGFAYAKNNPLRFIDPDGADPKDPKTVVVVIGGGSWLLAGLPGSSSGSSGGGRTDNIDRVQPYGSVDGIGETKLDAESPHIAQQVKNEFPNVDVIFAGPDATDSVLKDLTTNKPDNILIYGYSRVL